MLNDAKVRAAKPREKAYKLTDSNRLFLLVTPSGGKLWRWNYSYDGKQKSMSFGIYPMVALVTAREKRDEARAVLADPVMAERSISDIAFSLGFQDLSHFSRRFNERFGCSPREFRGVNQRAFRKVPDRP